MSVELATREVNSIEVALLSMRLLDVLEKTDSTPTLDVCACIIAAISICAQNRKGVELTPKLVERVMEAFSTAVEEEFQKTETK